MGVEELAKIVISTPWFYAGIGVILLLIIFAVARKNSKKNILNRLSGLQVRYAAVKTVPLAFKMNKANALAKVNPEMEAIVTAAKPDYDQIQEQLKNLSELLNVTDDLVMAKQYSDAKKNNNDIDKTLNKVESLVKKVNGSLDEVLKQETEQRDKINVLKEEFRQMRIRYNESANSYVYSYEAIEQKILEVEKQFSEFEEYMYASDFKRAGETKNVIEGQLAELNRIYDKLPGLLSTAKVLVPNAAKELENSTLRAKNLGVYLRHLELSKNVGLINDAMRTDMTSLKNAEIDGVEEHLADCLTRLAQLKGQVDKEIDAYNRIEPVTDVVFTEVRSQREILEEMERTYKEASARYGFDNLDEKMATYRDIIRGYEEKEANLERQIAKKDCPATGIIIGCTELGKDIDQHSVEFLETKQRLDRATEDENNAKLDLLKMHLIMNEMRSRVRKQRLTSISESYEHDLQTAEEKIGELENILKITPLNISRMNEKLEESKDFVFTLYNNVNKILGSATTVENAIVIANRMRSRNQEVDMELNRSEMAYRNGEYTQALQLAYNAIELAFPGQAKKLITENSQKEFRA